MDEKLSRYLLPFFHIAMKYHQYEIRGLENIPKTRGAIILVNHSLATYDALLFGVKLYLETGRAPFGLADHNFFKFPFLQELTQKINFVEGNHTNGEILLNAGELLCIAPGGMREALRPMDERYKILWHKRKGFARLSIKTQTPIILAACPQADQIFDVYPNFFTKMLYKKFKLPFVAVKGIGLTLIPKPIKLVHHIRPPLVPPSVHHASGRRFEKKVEEFHRDVLHEMQLLMEQALEVHRQEQVPLPLLTW